MPIVIVEAIAPWASWRPPEALTYHRTLPLPPYTALVGTIGAALGLDLPGAYQYVAEHRLRLGVGGWHEGHARDLWKFQKLELADASKGPKTDVLLREHWVDSRLVIVIEAPDDQVAAAVEKAFREPAYPLTAGPSDALMHAVRVRITTASMQASNRLAFAQVFREITPNYRLDADLNRIPFSQMIRAPSVERLPTGFAFDIDAPRRLLGRDSVTFVADPIVLADGEAAVDGYVVEPESPLLSRCETYRRIRESTRNTQEHAPWLIPVHRYDSPPAPEASSSTKPSPRGSRRRPIDNT